MNAIQTKVMQMYENYTKKVDCTNKVLALSVLVRENSNTDLHDDCVYITNDGKPCAYGTQCVKNIGEVLSLCSPIEFLPDEFPSLMVYRSELLKYVVTPEDETYYFPVTRFGFNIMDIMNIAILPMIDDEPIIGHKEEITGGIAYYGEQTDNEGFIFKDMNAIRNREGVCYIATCAFEQDGDKNGCIVLTPNNIFDYIENGSVETYSSARKSVNDLLQTYYPEFANISNWQLWHKFVDWLTDKIFNEVDWQCFGTMLNDMDLDEQLDMFLANEFVEYAKERIKKENDDTDLDEGFGDRLFDFLGENCFRNDDFSLTSWDSLIDKWIDDPAGMY